MFSIQTHLPVQHFAKAGVAIEIDLNFLGLCRGPWSVLVLRLEGLLLEIQFLTSLPFLDPENFKIIMFAGIWVIQMPLVCVRRLQKFLQNIFPVLWVQIQTFVFGVKSFQVRRVRRNWATVWHPIVHPSGSRGQVPSPGSGLRVRGLIAVQISQRFGQIFFPCFPLTDLPNKQRAVIVTGSWGTRAYLHSILRIFLNTFLNVTSPRRKFDQRKFPTVRV